MDRRASQTLVNQTPPARDPLSLFHVTHFLDVSATKSPYSHLTQLVGPSPSRAVPIEQESGIGACAFSFKIL